MLYDHVISLLMMMLKSSISLIFICFIYWLLKDNSPTMIVDLLNFPCQAFFFFALCILRLCRQWHPTPVLLPGKSHWRRSLVGCKSMRSLRVGHDWGTSLSLFTFMHCGRKWQPTPVFFPGESQGRGSLVGCRLWGRIESDMTEVT